MTLTSRGKVFTWTTTWQSDSSIAGYWRRPERWPPWRQGLEYDAGLFFLCYQQDPRTGFTRIFENMSKIDLLNQYTTHVASALFAIPPGTGGETGYVGQSLFRAAGLRGA